MGERRRVGGRAEATRRAEPFGSSSGGDRGPLGREQGLREVWSVEQLRV